VPSSTEASVSGEQLSNLIRNWLFLTKKTIMFGLFKKKSEKEKLEEKYQKLLDESYRLSKTDRAASDLKAAEADEILKKIELLDKQS